MSRSCWSMSRWCHKSRDIIGTFTWTCAWTYKFSLLSRTILRWCWVFLERTRIFSGIQFTTHFIGFFVVDTERFVGSFVNVILTRQTCGQRTSRAAESKRRALGNYFSGRICFMLLMSKCRGGWYHFFLFAKRKPLRNDDFWKNPCFARRKKSECGIVQWFSFRKYTISA